MDNKKPIILLIEDDTFIREMIHKELVRAGLDVQSCESGAEALTALQSSTFDLILLDIMLPDTNGIQLLRQIKSNPVTQNIRVVFLTNLGNDNLIKEGFELGAVGYLIKSAYNPDQIITEIKQFLVATPQ